MAQMIRRRVGSGAYASNSEIIREALRLWQDREEMWERQLEAVRAKIDQAIDNPVRLTPKQVRQRLDRLHKETVKRRG